MLTEARYSDADSGEIFRRWQRRDIRMLTAPRYSDADSGEYGIRVLRDEKTENVELNEGKACCRSCSCKTYYSVWSG